VSPATWLVGTPVEVFGSGFPLAGQGSLTATLDGQADGARHAFRVALAATSADRAVFTATADVLAMLPVDGAPVRGRLAVERSGDRVDPASASVDVEIAAVSLLTPARATCGRATRSTSGAAGSCWRGKG
jgi:hypothetical protein